MRPTAGASRNANLFTTRGRRCADGWKLPTRPSPTLLPNTWRSTRLPATVWKSVLALFEAYATDPAVRDAIDKGRFAALTGTTLPLAQYIAVPDEHRERIPGYVRAHLLDGEQAA